MKVNGPTHSAEFGIGYYVVKWDIDNHPEQDLQSIFKTWVVIKCKHSKVDVSAVERVCEDIAGWVRE